MTRFGFSLTFAALWLISSPLQAQFNPKESVKMMFTVGVGASGWGIPLFARLEVPAAPNITIGGGASYQTNSERFINNQWSHTIIGLHGRGSYHFNEVLSIPDEWDFYAGASAGYYIWNTTYKGDLQGINYNGSGAGGFAIGIHVGGRYFVKEKIAINLEGGGGNVFGSGTIGATFLL